METFFVNPSTPDNVERIVLRASSPGFAAKTKNVADRVRGASMDCCRPVLLTLVVMALEETQPEGDDKRIREFVLAVLAIRCPYLTRVVMDCFEARRVTQKGVKSWVVSESTVSNDHDDEC